MRSSTRLDSALFQLTPTRTRCDLVISANGKTEKIASGLLDPFLSHLKTAQEQMAKGGYSIILEPESGSDAAWFTKSTVERFVRFVSTPEVLERVYTLESEILQIEEAITIQGNHDMGFNPVEDNHGKPMDSIEGNRPVLDTNEEKAIVLYEAGARKPEANGSAAQEENSKVQLLKVLETRKKMLQKEQGMAFARAVAAGFDVDHLPPLISFAECFGASRLMEACRRYKELWKRKHETGQWLEIEAAEAMSNRADFSTMNASGIVLSSMTNKPNELAENNGKATSADEKPPLEHQPSLSHQEYFPGQFPHQMFPPWPVHSPGALPVYPPYPMQGMPYYQNYPGNSPFFQPPYPTAEDPRLNQSQKMKQKRHSMDGSPDNDESEAWEIDASRTRSSDDTELERESRKKSSRSGKKKSGTVVIRNINYITSKGKNSSDGESQSGSDSQTDEEDGNLQDGILEVMNSLKSTKRKGNHRQSIDKFDSSEKEANGDNWQAFQNFLLRDADEDNRNVDQGMFSMEKKVQQKRRQSNLGDDPLLSGNRHRGESQEGSTTDISDFSGNVNRMPKSSNGELLMSVREGQLGHSRIIDGQMDLRSEIDGRRVGYRRTANDDFMIHGQDNQSGFIGSPSDPLAVNGFEHATRSSDRRSSHNMNDDSYIVPLRSMSLDHVESSDRNAIDMDSEFPSEDMTHKIAAQVNYEPDELSLMPQRGAERGSTSYDPALDYEMQVHINGGAALDKKHKDMVSDVKGAKKPGNDKKSKIVQNTSEKKIGGPIRKGKPAKLSPLEEARARAEKLRSFKADLQKMKKEKEEEEIKRLEALKIQRQKRIAARAGSIPAQSPLPSQQTRKQGLTKLSPSSHKGSKFSDSEPGSSSPLQRFPIKTASMGGSTDSQKTAKSSKLNTGSHSAGNRLSRSVSSLPEKKKENSGVKSDPKSSMARIRRLSEPKMPNSNLVSSVKPQNTVIVSKPKASDGSESKKISAIVNYDKSKAASLPELKIRTSKGPAVAQSTSTAKETSQKDVSVKPTSGGAQLKRNDDKSTHRSDKDDNPVIEKTVLMLEKTSIPIVHAPGGNLEVGKGQHVQEKTKVVSDYAAVRAPVSPLTVDVVDREPIHELLQQQVQSHEAPVDNSEKETPKFSSNSTVEKPYQAPYVRQSSLEDPCTVNSEYGKAPSTSSETMATGTATIRAYVSESSNLKLEKIPEAVEKPQVKESSKGFRRLLKFGRKNHSSSSGERNGEPDNTSMIGSEADDNATNTVSSSEVFTLKNLISQDETSNSSATSKGSRHFSLLSPFRSKTSEKKLTT